MAAGVRRRRGSCARRRGHGPVDRVGRGWPNARVVRGHADRRRGSRRWDDGERRRQAVRARTGLRGGRRPSRRRMPGGAARADGRSRKRTYVPTVDLASDGTGVRVAEGLVRREKRERAVQAFVHRAPRGSCSARIVLRGKVCRGHPPRPVRALDAVPLGPRHPKARHADVASDGRLAMGTTARMRRP
ncbi:MAG: hypothetical protein QOI98_2982 [Solirubrobacteraceae bacterium]|nr:hypothetical protein [Solirubrobacteraceae bacterium]